MADGDLDGDGKEQFEFITSSCLHCFPLLNLSFLRLPTDYFVLWDKKILDHLLKSKDKLTTKSRSVLRNLKLPDGVQPSVDKSTNYSTSSDRNWFTKAQDMML